MTSLAYRPADTEDHSFVVESWLSSYKTAHAAGLIAMASWREVMVPQIERVLAKPGVQVHVAYHPGEQDRGADLYGWIAAEPGAEPLVHYVYVKQPYRRMGIARGLLGALGIDPASDLEYTCKTPIVSRLPLPRARWQPLRARFDEAPKTKPRNHGQDQRRHRR
jgi:GNAT superfamily N-acetyltransferase